MFRTPALISLTAAVALPVAFGAAPSGALPDQAAPVPVRLTSVAGGGGRCVLGPGRWRFTLAPGAESAPVAGSVTVMGLAAGSKWTADFEYSWTLASGETRGLAGLAVPRADRRGRITMPFEFPASIRQTYLLTLVRPGGRCLVRIDTATV